MIKIENLTHTFGKKSVLEQVQLYIEEGERCALVGRNGAGKSTMIHLMLGLLPIQQGTVQLGGISNRKQDWKKVVSYLPEKFHLYPHLTGIENMRFFASLAPKKIDEEQMLEKLESVSLSNARNDMITTYSKGMLQRLGLAVMLYYDSDIIILDEPTSGLDPMGREEILNIIRALENKTILMASHHLSEIEKVCTHVAFLENGKIEKFEINDFMDIHMKETKK
ncbi:ABC transporter ATP-binding protein [Ammoniphilus oxalaticus]|uniref:ABC transporter ATP-binding protein n=1 Tax=Ammoniphilus oxalaticus TaxID=66863 RepID=A0A419SK69_9BACL|nr:ABC transporter ATP-binding protein [Ammoniphilus oxalaticus]RKD24413.1 ABC transporter ATP-binding protein [Ammoniphilus oxalaticus]